MCQDSQWDIPMASHKFFFKNTHFTTEMSQHQRKLQTNHLHTEQMQLTPFISHQLSFILLFVTKWEILTMKGEWGFTDRSVSAKLRKHAKLNRGIETYILLFVSFSLFRALPQTCLINNSLRKILHMSEKSESMGKEQKTESKASEKNQNTKTGMLRCLHSGRRTSAALGNALLPYLALSLSDFSSNRKPNATHVFTSASGL